MAEKNKNNNSLIFADNGYLSYIDFSKLSLTDKLRRRLNIAKAQYDNGSLAKAGYALVGGYDPENPRLSTGDVPNPGMRNPKLILLSAKLMETINNYWKNLGKLKIRLEGNGKYASGILTKPGTAPTTFNGLNISYITSPKGGSVTHKFYTDLGSEYILTKDGFARRIKTPHTNTEGVDAGLHEWNLGKTYFLDDKGNFSGQFRLIKEKVPNIAVATGKDGKMYFMNTDTNKLILNEEIFPIAVRKGILPKGYYSVPYSLEPKLGYSIFEFGTNGTTGKIDWYHPGSSVAFIEGLKQGGKMIRKMLTAAGGPLFPWLKQYTEWSDNWKFRTTPSSRSRVLSGKGVETDKQYTERRKKEETKRTWRSDAADIAHGISEGVLALHPYTAIPYFGAKVGLDFLNGTYGWQTALNASVPLFHLSPQAVGLREATNVVLEDAANVGSKTARNWRVAREIKLATKNKPNIKIPKPIIRTKVGDVEINNPQLAYRQGKGITEDFIKKGKVEAKQEPEKVLVPDSRGWTWDFTPQHFDRPMFAQGRPWFGSKGEGGGDLLVTAEPLSLGNANGGLVPWKGNRTFDVRYELGRLHSPVGIRRVPAEGQVLDTNNTIAYTWKPGYGYKLVVKEPSTSLNFFERGPAKKPLSQAEQQGMTKGERNLPKPSFRSELNWSPEDWFEKTAGRKYKDGSLTQYTDKDIKELNSHIPEYLEIEARSKKNGTWLKTEDGNNWYGDPRSWVLMLSKNLKLYDPEDFWTGIHNSENYLEINSINPEYNGQIWGVYGQKFLSAAKARTYAPNDNSVFHMVSSKKTPTVVYDALGKSWYDIGGQKVGDQYITGKTTNEIINDNFSKGIERVKINNVSDTGPNKIRTDSKYSTGDFILDWETLNSPGVHQNDIILSPGSFRKSLIGNNGAFNPKENMYRGLIPLTTGYTLYNLLNQPLLKLQYQKQGGKMNILEFLKKGSGIYIKPSKRGSFTRWCGGNVTEECIRRGKNSPNAAIRKKATFADNARHFKHKKGGKAFVNGVNVLDSNPKMSKAASRKVKKGQFGLEIQNQILNPNAMGGTAFTSWLNYLLKLPELLKLLKEKEQRELELKLQEAAQKTSTIQSIIGAAGNFAMNKLGNLLNKKVDNGAPSKEVTVNGQTVNKENLGAYGLFMT